MAATTYYALWDAQCGRRMCTGRNCTTKKDVKQEIWEYLEPDREEVFLTDKCGKIKLQTILDVCEFVLEESKVPFPEDEY